MDTTRVRFATDYTTNDGKHHKGGAEVAVPAPEARALVHRGVVQVVREKDLPPTQLADTGKPADTKAGK